MENHMCFLFRYSMYAMHKTTFFIIKLWYISEILSFKVTNVTIASFRDVRLGSGKSFIVCIVLAEGTKIRLVLVREIQESLVFDLS